MFLWLRFVDDTIAAVKVDSIDYVQTKLLSTPYPVHSGNRTKQSIFRKPNSSYRYLTQNAFVSKNWRYDTLKTLVLRADKVCSTPELRRKELQHLTKIFHIKNGYPKQVIKEVMQKMEEGIISEAPLCEGEQKNQQLIVLPYKGLRGGKD